MNRAPPRRARTTAGGAWRAWLHPAEAVCVVAGMLVLVLLAADVLSDGLFTRLDATVADLAASRGRSADWMRTAADAGGFGVSGAVVLIVTLMSAQRTWRWWPLGLTLGVVATTSCLVVVTKTLVARDGPPGSPSPQGYAGYFPSGHTATSVVCLGTAAFLLTASRRHGLGVGKTPSSRARWSGALTASRVVGLGAGLVVGTGTVLTGYHWMSDAAAGIALGMVVLVAGTAAARRYVCGPEPARPGSPHHRPGGSVGGTP